MNNKEIFVNLPVKDLSQSVAFFSKLGYQFDPRFTDENAVCMIIGENMYAMLLLSNFFQRFTPKEIANSHKTTEVLVALSCGSRTQIDEIVDKAMEAGASFNREPEDHGWMYSRSFQDIDGHIWEYLYADLSQAPKQ